MVALNILNCNFAEEAESLPATPEQPETENHQGELVDSEDDSEDDEYLPSQSQPSGSSGSFLNPSSQNVDVSYFPYSLVKQCNTCITLKIKVLMI